MGAGDSTGDLGRVATGVGDWVRGMMADLDRPIAGSAGPFDLACSHCWAGFNSPKPSE